MSWTLRCLAKKCGRVFNANSAEAKCPKCKSARTRWIPGGIAIGSHAKGVDSVARSLAADYGMGDFASPERGQPARRIQEATKTVDYEPVPGWKVKVPLGPGGQAQAACAPTGQSVKIRPSEGTVGRTKLGMPATKIEGSYRPSPK